MALESFPRMKLITRRRRDKQLSHMSEKEKEISVYGVEGNVSGSE